MPGDTELDLDPTDHTRVAETPAADHGRPEPEALSRRKFLIGGGLSLAGLTVYATEIARHELDVVRREIRIENLPVSFDGFQIAQLSDIHLEEFTEDFFLKIAIETTNSLKPDMVLLTGDFISDGPRPDSFSIEVMGRCGDLLGGLKVPLRYAVLGNHDSKVSAPAVLAGLRENGITPLVNQFVRIERGGEHLWLSGLDDIGMGHPDLDLAVPRQLDAPLLLMCHEPDYFNTIVRHPRGSLADLVLCGHTHGGQIRLPFLPPVHLPPLGKLYAEGLFRFNGSQLYVNRGLGTVGIPMRLNCPPEITLLTLRRA